MPPTLAADALARVQARRAAFSEPSELRRLFRDGSIQTQLAEGGEMYVFAEANNDYPFLQTRLRDAANNNGTVFIGDSITNNFLFAGLPSWRRFQEAGINPINFGVGGDTIENALFRYRMYSGHVNFTDAQSGVSYTLTLFQDISPKLFVIDVGTNDFWTPMKSNNITDHGDISLTPEQMAAAIVNFGM
jgi:hypothetical protein